MAGVFLPPWGKVEQWLLSVQHTDDDVDRLVANFGRRWPDVAERRRGRLMTGGALRLASLTKSFGDVVAVDGIDLDLPARRVLLAARRLRAAARPRRCG